MSLGSYASVLLALGFVLALVGVAAKLLRKFAPGSIAGRARLPMEVVQRLAISPRQGIALVRLGDRVVAVSTGEGGVRTLFELTDDERRRAIPGLVPSSTDQARDGTPRLTDAWIDDEAIGAARRNSIIEDDAEIPAFLTTPATSGARSSATPPARDFTSLMRGAMKNAGVPFVLLLFALSLARPLAAQQPAAPAPAARPTAPAPAGANAVGARVVGRGPIATSEQVVERLAPQLDLRVGGGEQQGLRLSGTVGVVVMMGLLTLLPMLLLMMTSFTRIFIVFSFLKQALGTQSAPPAQLVAGLALLLTGFIMAPTFAQMNREALQPWLNGEIEQAQMLEVGAKPFKAFMLRQTRPSDVRAFVRMSGQPAPARAEELPLVTLTSAFVTSELRTAFQIGFALFLPFIVIDIVVSAVLMSMGMMMLPPAMIALPFKLLLFVLVDGWSLVLQSLVASFR